MPNLYHPIKINVFGHIKVVKTLHNDFIKAETEVQIPIQNANLYHTDIDSDSIYIKLGTDAREVFGAMKLEKTLINNSTYYTVKMVGTNSRFLNKGIVRCLYHRAVEMNLKLASDEAHTTFGSKDIWLKFRNYFPQKSVYIINIINNHKRLFDTQPHYKIWEKEEDEDFDILDIEDKLYLLEELYESSVISKEQLTFFSENLKNLSDLRNIRLLLE